MTALYRIKMGFVNCYLLKAEGHSILVDTAAPGSRSQRQLIRKMGWHGVSPGYLDLVLLTHNHGDHTGLAAYLRARGIPVAMHPADSPQPGALTGQGGFGRLLLAASTPQIERQPPVTVDIPLRDGMDLGEYGMPDAMILSLPGHTAGSVGILFDDGRLICGDAYMNFARPHSAWIAEDFPALRGSIERLKSFGTLTVYPGHGRPFSLANR